VSVLVSVPRVLQVAETKDRTPNLEDRGKIEHFSAAVPALRKEKHFLHRWWMFRGIRRQFGWKFWAFICGGAALDAETEEFWGRARLRCDPGIRVDGDNFADQRESIRSSWERDR